MADEMLRLQLERDLARFKSAGMDDHVQAVEKRLAELTKDEKAEAPASKPRKTTRKTTKTATKKGVR